MKPTIEIQAVDLVRNIRDDMAAQLAGKSIAETMEFFHRAAEQARRRSGKLPAVSKSNEVSHKALQPTAQKSRRG